MEEDIEMEIEPVFEVRSIDLDYEFDAARFFDFTREESPAEVGEAELWFDSAPTYPPSPFVTKLVMSEESLLENVNTSPKCDEEDTSTLHESDPQNVMALEFSDVDAINKGNEGTNRGISANIQKILQNALNQSFQLTTGLTTYNHLPSDRLKAKSKRAKPMQRSSTLMKPTASQLAKQNHPPQAATSRFQKLQALNSNRSLGNSSVVESQAAKRQKLEGGLLRKVDEVKQQTTLVHKAPKKEGTKDRNAINTKLRLTVPREPELETAHRAQRIRPKNGREEELVTSVTHRFKARPLNRKILEGHSLPVPKKSVPKLPEFQEFHLKTLERAVQLSSAVSSSSIHANAADKGLQKPRNISANGNGTREARRPSVMDATSQDVCDTKYNFKARPLNRKIFSSKGDIGVFRNIKKETTVPMEFNFQTQKRVPQNPPVELFSKLSLTSELQPSNGSQMKFPRPTFISTKGSKENRFTSFQPEHEARHLTKEKPLLWGK
ncbi:TPX2-LIKE PROTEIN 3 [Hibiscus trionum]|uniref:TPX2-LIKE PROTEIN 3 n=1 Tax=Hibiscus trionum TaxID=183268 RepID=A0A9W7J112_HIBTR|nr:TPX2-LIKE PROTEIN 3 [Hibiscus trionum]